MPASVARPASAIPPLAVRSRRIPSNRTSAHLFFAALRLGVSPLFPVRPMTANELAKIVVDPAYKIHEKPDPGLLESTYHAILIYERQLR